MRETRTDREPVYRTAVDRGEQVTTAVVFAVSTVLGIDPIEAPPLEEVIDPDALNMLFLDPIDEAAHDSLVVEFPYMGYTVTVDGNGWITVYGGREEWHKLHQGRYVGRPDEPVQKDKASEERA